MSKPKEVLHERYGDAAKEAAGNARTSCCGPSCCSAQSTSDRPKEVSGEKYGDAAGQAENGAKNSSCCEPSCCA